MDEAGRRKTSVETDFWAGLFLDLTLRVEWVAQTLDSVPHGEASAAALVRLRSYARALEELHRAIEHVHAHRAQPYLKPLFSLEGPLAGYLSRLFAWCDEVGADFERMAISLRRREPTMIVFSHKAVNGSYAQFDELISAMRRADEIARELHGDEDAAGWRRFDEHLEELIWATEWLHMTLARRPGE
ncbi:MAG TPA: hypothetical protein VGH28_27840 [Polyangiaceae bacterium]|jgi:hypothetical protein